MKYKQQLQTWVTIDVAIIRLLEAVGLMDSTVDDYSSVAEINNPIGDAAYMFLNQMVYFGAIEFDEENDAYRWREGYNWDTCYAKSLQHRYKRGGQ